jgi:hypothetical protein
MRYPSNLGYTTTGLLYNDAQPQGIPSAVIHTINNGVMCGAPLRLHIALSSSERCALMLAPQPLKEIYLTWVILALQLVR